MLPRITIESADDFVHASRLFRATATSPTTGNRLATFTEVSREMLDTAGVEQIERYIRHALYAQLADTIEGEIEAQLAYDEEFYGFEAIGPA